MLATASIALYFILNLLVTITNKTIIQSTSAPYLLTASHATASFISTTIISRFQPATSRSRFASTYRINLILFSALFTINITFSNFTLGLVSLPVHQIVRAIAPVLTILISVGLQLRMWSSYTPNTYMSLIPIILGVVAATYDHDWKASWFGVAMTFLGAVTAVIKTITTHSLQTDLGMKSYELIRVTAPLAVVQSLTAAWYHDEFTTMVKQLKDTFQHPAMMSSFLGLVSLLFVNVLLAAALNLASFEANKRWGALSMGVAANLKQVAILFIPDGPQLGKVVRPSPHVVIGSLMTVGGGLWYAFAQKRHTEKIERQASFGEAENKAFEKV